MGPTTWSASTAREILTMPTNPYAAPIKLRGEELRPYILGSLVCSRYPQHRRATVVQDNGEPYTVGAAAVTYRVPWRGSISATIADALLAHGRQHMHPMTVLVSFEYPAALLPDDAAPMALLRYADLNLTADDLLRLSDHIRK